jgi:general secretion pathway protein D
VALIPVIVGLQNKGVCMITKCAITLIFAMGAVLAFAAEGPLPTPSIASQGENGQDLRDLIVSTGTRLGRQFVVDPRVRGTVSLVGLKPDALTYHALLEVLRVHGFVALSSGDIVTVIPESLARTVATPIVTPDTLKGDDAEVVTVIVPTGTVDAAELATTLRPLVPQWGYMSPMEDKRSILLVDRVANARRIIAVIRSQTKGL